MDTDSIAHDPAHDAMVALNAMGTFQNYLQHADAKVSVLYAVLASSAAAMLSAAGDTSAVFALVYLAVFLCAGVHLTQAIRPRLNGEPTTSAFGILGITERLPADAVSQRDEAWAMARALAEAAALKHHHVVRAIPWTAASVVLALVKVLWGAVGG
ncbi:hypothetical protein [Actinomadura decatromicini]|uniref:Pycsar effector protein domain-containing protein n=1 Tax=Actinomadura decatromicini TaxID=2604572 RepID=A0A5D3FRC0_9ACTN|nr:hypothetical protein [Actinomadura decatromicini]TYK51347.1 hypothetical protein FXF68_13145 [Actinomadura decatromicini]